MKSLQDKLDQEFMDILGNDHVYFQPPASVKLKFPCIVYSYDTTNTIGADNDKYIMTNRYSVQHIFKNLSSEKKDEILKRFRHISAGNRFITDGLYHDNFTLFY